MDGMQVVFCPFCGENLNRLTQFCFSCGQSLEFIKGADQTEGPAAQETSQQPDNTKQTGKPCPSSKQFLEYRRPKSKERAKSGPRGRHRAKERKHVQINIGWMVPNGTDLKPLRGKTLQLFVDPEIEAPDVLKQAVQKMRTFNKEMPEGTYVLLYPDCSKVIHLPGSERPFKLSEYKKELGRPFGRITFFMCLKQHFKGALDDTSDSESEIVITSENTAEFNRADTVDEMKASKFRVELPGGLQVESEDSCPPDSDATDEVCSPAPNDESCSDDSDSDQGERVGTSTSRGNVPEQSASSKDKKVREPSQYFRDFFDADLLDAIVQQSNLFCTQMFPNTSLELDQEELEQFLGIMVYMSVLPLPKSPLYWSNECRVPQVADVMTRDRWKIIKKFLHFNDNSNIEAKKVDTLYEIRPVIDTLLYKFRCLPQDQMLSIHEHTVPTEGNSCPKKYNSRKQKAGKYKIIVLCDSKGMVHSFNISTGKLDHASEGDDIGEGGNIVLNLAQDLQGDANRLLCVHSWASLDLFAVLAKRGITAIGAVPQSHQKLGSFTSDDKMRKKGNGTFEETDYIINQVVVRAVKWFDKKGVIVGSSFACSQPPTVVKRWNKKQRKSVSLQCPSLISLYHQFLLGVDALDALIAFCHIQFKSDIYYHRLFFHLVDIVIVNCWLLYKRDCESLHMPEKMQKDYFAFRASLARELCMQGQDVSSRKRKQVENETHRKKGHGGPAEAVPTLEGSLDAPGHWPVVKAVPRPCILPSCDSNSVFKCSVCNIYLCLNNERNCFRDFHK